MSRNDSVLSVLRAARRLLAKKSRWAKGSFALDESGRNVNPTSHHAVRWCLAGAVIRACDYNNDLEITVTRLLYTYLRKKVWSLSRFNDAPHRTHKDILKLLDRAIKGE